MKSICRALALALVFAPAASFATKVPIPIEGATLNVSLQVQPQFIINEGGAPAGDSPSYDLFVRRTRILVNGDLGPNFTYLIQVDNANFGKFGNFTGRAIIQDAWIGWAPLGLTGGTVIFVDAGLLLVPLAHHVLMSTTNYVTADTQADAFRMPGSPLPALRDTGVQLRGWLANKRVGFRGGVFEGYTPFAAANCVPATAGTCIAPKRNPMLAGFVNFDVIGSEEGGWLYGAYHWSKDPILSVGLSTQYQSQVLRNAFGSLADLGVFGGDVYLNLPMGEGAELVAEGTAFLNRNGTGSANTGLGLSANLGYRFGNIAPYVAYDYFAADSCDSTLTAAQLAICNGSPGKIGTVGSADSRNFKVGINYFINKNLNHVNVEFGVNHGQSGYGPQSIAAGTAGYAPLALDPATGSTARRPLNVTPALGAPAFKSLLVHWNFLF